MRPAFALCLLLIACACAGGGSAPTSAVPLSSLPPATTTPIRDSPVTSSVVSATRPEPSTTVAVSTTTTTSVPTVVTSPGPQTDMTLSIHLAFRSEIGDVPTAELEATALTILNGPAGWNRSGFVFTADDSSELAVILAEGDRVDELCLPLETHGTVNCQNGPIVALNADRWRKGGDDWDSTVDAYRTYVVNHEVGHLIGLRHPLERCPHENRVSALMEPQTNNLNGCKGNGIPLEWEIEWARSRPAVIGPDPDWDGPRPSWPA